MKKFKIIATIITLALCFASCNKQIVDTQYEFNYAYINMADTYTVQGKVESWCDYENSDQIQVKINGVTYLVHSSDITLVYDPDYTDGIRRV